MSIVTLVSGGLDSTLMSLLIKKKELYNVLFLLIMGNYVKMQNGMRAVLFTKI